MSDLDSSSSDASVGPNTVRELIDGLRTSTWSPRFSVEGPDSALDGAVAGVTHDSRQVKSGSVFCCIRGDRTDGHHFAKAAVAAGATALLVDHRIDGVDVTQLVVDDTRAVMGIVAAAAHGFPADRLQLVGITGTNGKTTTAAMLASILSQAGRHVGVIGTLTQKRTTPEATDLQDRLAEFVAAGMDTVVMEVTSHALELHRVAAMRFAVGVFTNLTQDHLDFHETMEAYFRAKAKLFEPSRCDRGVVNGDDPYGRLLLTGAPLPMEQYRLVDAEELEQFIDHARFVYRGTSIELAIGGRFNVGNALAAATAASALGVALSDIASGLATVTVPGRFEPIREGQPFGVIVDFAHTPDGLAQVLSSARATMRDDAQLFVVFGCGGDRDAGKRPQMGAIARGHADRLFVTSDNPRSEDPNLIIQAILDGISDREDVVADPDRRSAIRRALREATAGDVVVIAGKGHESGQEVAGVVTPFDDRMVASEELRALGTTGGA